MAPGVADVLRGAGRSQGLTALGYTPFPYPRR